MDIEQIKSRVKEAFLQVESESFLKQKIENKLVAHRLNFKAFQLQFPTKTFSEWKAQNEDVNFCSTNNEELMAIGIHLIALDEFAKEFSD